MTNEFLIEGKTVQTLRVFRNLTPDEEARYKAHQDSLKTPALAQIQAPAFIPVPIPASIPVPTTNITSIAFTGHRYVREDEMQITLDEVTELYPGATWICGGAIGVDSFAAKYAMSHGINYRLILPFPPEIMSKYWNDAQKYILNETIAKASSVTVLTQAYNVTFYQKRNIAMVNAAQVLIAFYDGSSGGTANCVKYVQSKTGYPIKIYPGPYRNVSKRTPM